MQDTTAQYFEEVGRLTLPTKEEERANLMALGSVKRQLEVESDPSLRKGLQLRKARLTQKLASYYLRFVIGKAHARTKNKQLLGDLISAGNEGLLVAVSKFDTAYSNRFLTYAAYWISVKMDETIHRLGTVHASVHLKKKAIDTDTELPEITMTPCDDVDLPSGADVEREATPRGSLAMGYLESAELSLRDKVVLTYALGLRGEPRTEAEISQILFVMDGSVLMRDEVLSIKETALAEIRSWLSERPDVQADVELA